MKFETGQIVIHNPTKSRWIIMEAKPYEPLDPLHPDWPPGSGIPVAPKEKEKYKTIINAYCLYSGSNPNTRDGWKPSQFAEWVMTYRDCEDHDSIWEIV